MFINKLSNNIPLKIQNVLIYNSGVIHRISESKLITKNMKMEFLYIIKNIVKEKFNPDNWDSADDFTQGSREDEENNVCICTHEIYNLYYIKHINSGYIFKVGSECVKKIDNKLYIKITKDKCKIKNCEVRLTNKKNKYQKNGYCSEHCYLFKQKNKFVYGLNNLEPTFILDNIKKWNYLGPDTNNRKEYFKQQIPDVSEYKDNTCICGKNIINNNHFIGNNDGYILSICYDCLTEYIINCKKICKNCGDKHNNKIGYLCGNCRIGYCINCNKNINKKYIKCYNCKFN
jgi:hypothetical protein